MHKFHNLTRQKIGYQSAVTKSSTIAVRITNLLLQNIYVYQLQVNKWLDISETVEMVKPINWGSRKSRVGKNIKDDKISSDVKDIRDRGNSIDGGKVELAEPIEIVE